MGSDLVQMKSVMGRNIVEAIKAIAGDKAVIKRTLADGKPAFVLGVCSPYRHMHFAVESLSHEPIEGDTVYTEVRVKNHFWGGEVYMVGVNDGAEIEALRTFAQKLAEEVEKIQSSAR
ncbi:MAG: hypothetical protein A2845_04010 [Candidatus Lloydbacteria bacterium RIFCSPHIGHO2_01_FULL_49_22]|uniref:Uncharacterized protein n=1 Tax=Candidatus Lloydbacteria bacterium RIFCSPHIGHO2_01_FULL_49_22 TaxID=1798658 RepID=A0A1G2CZK6_9BACT|nr:MAG: hypothetical protein A2845_04010 [Candidatus Lloydbacteria bacterium RIFCSPHIGHO2_01_FULL_49_22]OGZ09091.1 MAG: hypothetical protein A3C14_03845 [Candidatus Lloydbacteria bacterium RIFCSPHIGHO2_02_FULL_50_18]